VAEEELPLESPCCGCQFRFVGGLQGGEERVGSIRAGKPTQSRPDNGFLNRIESPFLAACPHFRPVAGEALNKQRFDEASPQGNLHSLFDFEEFTSLRRADCKGDSTPNLPSDEIGFEGYGDTGLEQSTGYNLCDAPRSFYDGGPPSL
jgi:hypothetical protein